MKFKFSEPQKKKTNGNPPMKIEWIWDYGLLVPYCPNCNEMPYDTEECVFCHQKLIWVEKPKEYEDIVYQKENVRITQIYGTWSLYIEVDGQLVAHCSCAKQFTQKELEQMADKYIKGERKYGG